MRKRTNTGKIAEEWGGGIGHVNIGNIFQHSPNPVLSAFSHCYIPGSSIQYPSLYISSRKVFKIKNPRGNLPKQFFFFFLLTIKNVLKYYEISMKVVTEAFIIQWK